jgi:transglutaminase-like putative cysteine protease
LKTYNLPFLLLILFFAQKSYGKNDPKFAISSFYNTIQIDTNLNTYTSSFRIVGKSIGNSESYSIYYSELEKIQNLTVYYKNKGKLVKLNPKQYYQITMSDGSFYSGIRNTSFILPYKPDVDNSILITYDIVCSELKLLTEFRFYASYNIDTLCYQLLIPKKYKLNYCNSDLLKTNNIIIDSSQTSTNNYKFTKYGVKNIYDNKEFLNYIQYHYLFESIRYYIIPKEQASNAFESFADWYKTLLNEFDIDKYPTLKSEFSEITKEESNPDSIIKHAINYVKLKIRYIAIENGINAYKPRTPIEVLNNKKGDCKDMAFLLTHILKQYNIEAYVALIPSTYSKYDFNFPSLSSADHAICMVKRNNKWLVLDATDAIIPYPLGSRHTQGKTAFIVKNNGYELYKIPYTESIKNKITYVQDIVFTDTGVMNLYNYSYKGYSINKFLTINDENDLKRRQFNTLATLEQSTKNIVYISSNLTEYDTLIKIEGTSALNRSLFNKSNDKLFIATSFLPSPIFTNFKIDSNESVLLGEASNIELNCTITLPTKAKLNNPKTFTYNSYPYYLKITYTQKSDTKIQLKYEYKLEDISINYSDYTKYKALCVELKKALNYVLSIQ